MDCALVCARWRALFPPKRDNAAKRARARARAGDRSGDVRDPPASGAGEINGPPQQTSFEVTDRRGLTLYYCTPFNRVFALDVVTGKGAGYSIEGR